MDETRFTIPVHYDSPRWRDPIRKGLIYSKIYPGLSPNHMPIRGAGTKTVRMEYVHLGREADNQEVIHEIERHHRLPDRAEAETFLETNPDEQEKLQIVGICGFGSMAIGDKEGVVYVGTEGKKRILDAKWQGEKWSKDCRFLAVCKTS